MVGRKRGAIETAERDLWFQIDGGAQQVVNIDIGQCLSLLNRRMYRQGMQYVVEGLELHSDSVVNATIYRLPETWIVASAWEKVMRAWLEQQDEALEESDRQSLTAKYRDFKIYFNESHQIAGSASNAVPFGCTDLSALPTDVEYDWEYSQIVIPNDTTPGNTTERYLHMIGDDSAAVDESSGMIKAYAESRSRPFPVDPNTVGPLSNQGGILGEMVDVGDDDTDIIQNARSNNQQIPYPTGYFTSTEWYPGGANQFTSLGQLECIMSVRNTAPIGEGGIISTTYAPGFLASCGLIQVLVDAFAEEGTAFFKVGLSPGDYKGVMARSMAVIN